MKIESIESLALPAWLPAPSEIEAFFAERLPFHRFLRPHYKVRLLQAMARLFPAHAESALDLGAGDGLMASAMLRFFPVHSVRGVDVVNRLHDAATIDFSVYDGVHLPFADDSFDVVLTCNVMHHVPPLARPALLAEVSRICRGGVLLKDHLARNSLARLSLTLADWVGNAPFGGMVQADYLDFSEWSQLAAGGNFQMEIFDGLRLQTGPRGLVFPDKNEIMLRFRRDS
jgi:SAM-dependent methyltransferase